MLHHIVLIVSALLGIVYLAGVIILYMLIAPFRAGGVSFVNRMIELLIIFGWPLWIVFAFVMENSYFGLNGRGESSVTVIEE